MKKLLLAAVLSVACIMAIPCTVKADAALTAAQNFSNVQANWANQQVTYYNTYQVPVINQYSIAMTNQYSQALAATFQANVMATQAQNMANANAFQLAANQYAHSQNIATQYANMKDMALYNTVNTWDTVFYANQEMVARTQAAMLGQIPFPQVQ